MTQFQRMVVLPQEEYIQLSSLQNANQPLVQHMSQLEQQYHQVPKESQNPYDQLYKQGSILEAMKRTKERLREEMTLGTPKPYRNRALSLYRSLEPHMSLTERGELQGPDQQVYKDSRIEDLIQHAVRDRRRHFTPVAWDEFLTLLKQHNIPKSTLNRATLDELSQRTTQRSRPRSRSHPRSRARSRAPKRLPSRKTPSKVRPPSTRKRKPSQRYPNTDYLKEF